MNILRSRAQPELTYVLLTDQDVVDLRAALRKDKRPFSKTMRRELKKMLK